MKKILFILTALLALITTSCQEDGLGRASSGGPENGFRLSYTINDPVSVITKSSLESEVEENKINSFYILFFENSTDGSGEFVEVIDVKNTFGNELATSGELDITFPNDSKIDKDKDYKLLFCANIEAYSKADINNVADIENLCQGRTEKEVGEMTFLLEVMGVDPGTEGEQSDNSNRIENTNLPMSASAVKNASVKNISIGLSRIVSRFDVFCEVADYQLVSASIWNAATTSPIWNDYENEFDQSYTQRYYGIGTTNGQIIASLYAFENSVDASIQNDQTTCLIVGLKDNEDNIEYFRVDIKAFTDNTQSLKRNNAYRTIITGVKASGKITEEEAYISGGDLLDTDINGWFAGDGGNVQIKDGNILAIPTQHIQLYAHGDERTYYIYTLGEGTARLTGIQGSQGLTVYFRPDNEQSIDILKRYELKIKAEPGLIDESNPSQVTISFNGMTANIYITQKESLGSYLTLTPADQLFFMPVAPQTSGDIVVNSSGRWKAEIYNGDYFSFESGSTPVTQISGNPGDSFKIHAIESNSESASRYSFVVVYLEGMESVSDAIVLQQFGNSEQYLIVNPTTFPLLSAGGGSTDNIHVVASGAWTATIKYSGGDAKAYFQGPINEDEEEDEDADPNAGDSEEEGESPTYSSWNSTKGDSFVVTIEGQTRLNVSTTATVTVKLTGTNIEKVFTVEQATFTNNSLIIQTTARGKRGSLNDLKRAVTHKYVYNLAANLRNTSLFGPDASKVSMNEGYSFMYQKKPNDLSRIYQITGTNSKTYFGYVKTWFEKDSRKFIFFSTNGSYCSSNIDHYHNKFGDKGFKVTNYINADAGLDRTFNSNFTLENLDSNKLIAYLLKDGPFTQGGNAINPKNLKFKSYGTKNSALTNWPATFIPIIMAGGDNTKCVFGIDPTNRVIWLSDSGIFGSKTSSHANYSNFASPDAQKFLNNFIAWMTYATSIEGWYVQYQ